MASAFLRFRFLCFSRTTIGRTRRRAYCIDHDGNAADDWPDREFERAQDCAAVVFVSVYPDAVCRGRAGRDKRRYAALLNEPRHYSANALIVVGALCWVIYAFGASTFKICAVARGALLPVRRTGPLPKRYRPPSSKNLERRSRYCISVQSGYRPDDRKIRGGIMRSETAKCAVRALISMLVPDDHK
jgi:hypothetical protein